MLHHHWNDNSRDVRPLAIVNADGVGMDNFIQFAEIIRYFSFILQRISLHSIKGTADQGS